MTIPETYNHKATSESFNGTEKAVIYYSNEANDYLVIFESQLNEDLIDRSCRVFLNKTQLELLIHAGTDVLDMEKV